MEGYSILMIIFGAVLCLAGLAVYKGHDELIVRGRPENPTPEYLRYLGTIIMLVSLAPLLSGISARLYKKDTFIPIMVLLVVGVAAIVLPMKLLKEENFKDKK